MSAVPSVLPSSITRRDTPMPAISPGSSSRTAPMLPASLKAAMTMTSGCSLTSRYLRVYSSCAALVMPGVSGASRSAR
jgi:hypothetical protein